MFKSQLAAQNQSQLVAQVAAQAKARVGAAQSAQQALSVGGSANGSTDTQTLLGVQGKSRLDELRAAALRRAGIA
jgi:hypothetical protein